MRRSQPLSFPPSSNMQGLGAEFGGRGGMEFGGFGVLHSTPSTVQVDFLMPNSIIIQHKVDTSASLEEIKEVSECVCIHWVPLDLV